MNNNPLRDLEKVILKHLNTIEFKNKDSMHGFIANKSRTQPTPRSRRD